MNNVKKHLIDYISNGKQRVEGLEEEITKLSNQGDYEGAEKIKCIKNELKNTLYRLERISKGLPAFELSVNLVSK